MTLRSTPRGCRLCGEATQPFHTRMGERLYHHCPACGFILLDPSLHPTFEKQRERYLQHENNPEHPGYVAMFREFLKTCVTPYSQPGCRTLDLGCGPGPALSDGKESKGPVLAGLLKEAGHPTEIYDPLFFPDVPSGDFGLVTCTEVLEHLADPVAALKPWTTRLGREGIISGMTLFHPDDPVKFGEWSYARDFTHVSFYLPRTLEVLAKALGLSLVFTDGERRFVMKRQA